MIPEFAANYHNPRGSYNRYSLFWEILGQVQAYWTWQDFNFFQTYFRSRRQINSKVVSNKVPFHCPFPCDPELGNAWHFHGDGPTSTDLLPQGLFLSLSHSVSLSLSPSLSLSLSFLSLNLRLSPSSFIYLSQSFSPHIISSLTISLSIYMLLTKLSVSLFENSPLRGRAPHISQWPCNLDPWRIR